MPQEAAGSCAQRLRVNETVDDPAGWGGLSEGADLTHSLMRSLSGKSKKEGDEKTF
jgi:hypothetical protein